MRFEAAIILWMLLTSGLGFTQPPSLKTRPPAQSPAQTAVETAYYAGPGVSPPELLPIDFNDVAASHCDHFNGSLVLSAVIDSRGMPHQIYFVKPTGDDLDKIAIRVLKKERFKPGTHNGAPVATVVAIQMDMKACLEERQIDGGQVAYAIALRSLPNQKIELKHAPYEGAILPMNNAIEDAPPIKLRGDITPPKPLKAPDPPFSQYARENKIQGVCTLSLIVDANGLPQNVRIAKSLEASLDQRAIETVERWRFRPAMNGATPIAVEVSVEVDFHLN